MWCAVATRVFPFSSWTLTGPAPGPDGPLCGGLPAAPTPGRNCGDTLVLMRRTRQPLLVTVGHAQLLASDCAHHSLPEASRLINSGVSLDFSIVSIASRTILAFFRLKCRGKFFSSFSKYSAASLSAGITALA